MRIEEEMRKRKQGLTLNEKIEKELEKVKKKAVVSHMGDSFYKQVEECGNIFYLRRTNLLRDNGRTLNIVDEIEVQDAEDLKRREEEEKRDITFDEFKTKFIDHIEGTANLDGRSAHDSVEEDGGDAPKSNKKGNGSKKGTEMNKTVSQMGDEEDERKSIVSAGMKSNSLNKSKTDMNVTVENFKYEIPESCHVGMMKRTLIEKLDAKYLLVAHPYPLVEGQMMIFLPKKVDQKETEVIMYRDYSLRKRIETTSKVPESKVDKLIAKKTAEANKEKKEKNQFDQKLQCLEIDIVNPLAEIEWRNFAEVIDEVQGLGWFQILPVGQKSSQPYQFNMLHVIPESKIPVEKLPLDVFITNRLGYQRKREREGTLAGTEGLGKAMTHREELDILAQSQGLYLIPEYEFEHCLFPIGKDSLSSDPGNQMYEIYKRCCDFLRF